MNTIAWLSIGISVVCALWIAIDEYMHPQAMSVMNFVWPITALYFSIFAIWGYYRIGRTKTKEAMRNVGYIKRDAHETAVASPTAKQVAVGTSHCRAGCMVADILCEFGIALAGITLLGSVLCAVFVIDFAAAWALGILFQYLAIKQMGKTGTIKTLTAAIKADTLSILTFQIGMYGWMALVFFTIYPHPHLSALHPQYWLMMQIAMICGYGTAYPMNWWLIKSGIKEAM
jgi:hypothetical protein